MDTLGERIRSLRKQRRMTLAELAGDRLTKGMLSLIENNKAKPSMESLSYIAERLDVETSVLLQEFDVNELRDVLKEAERLLNVTFLELTDEYKQVIELIEPYADRLTQGYEAARLLELYGKSLYYEESGDWQHYMEKAETLYDQMNTVRRLASVGIFYSMVKFQEHAYAEALSVLLRKRKEIEERHGLNDALTRLDFDYLEAALHYAVGNAEEAIRVMNEAISYSRENQIFYRATELYKLAMVDAMMREDEEAMERHGRKLRQYGEFADDEEAVDFSEYLRTHYLTSYLKRYKEAFDWLQSSGKGFCEEEGFSPYFLLEQGKALYGLGRYEEALESLQQVTIAPYLHHPFDLSIFYEKDSYAALCYLALGLKEEARRAIETAVANISAMPWTPYQDFIMNAHEQIEAEL